MEILTITLVVTEDGPSAEQIGDRILEDYGNVIAQSTSTFMTVEEDI